MSKVSQAPSAVLSFLRQVSASVGQSRGAIHWSSSKKKFVKANNKTIADESQVRRFYADHPDKQTYDLATIHLGPGAGLPLPIEVLGDSSAATQTEIKKLGLMIEDYRAGQLESQELLEQTREALRHLGETHQKLLQMQPMLESRDQQLASDVSELLDAIRQFATQLKDQEEKFGQQNEQLTENISHTNEQLAQSIAFNQQLKGMLDAMQQKLQDLEDKVGQMNDAQRATFVRTTASSASYPSLSYVLTVSLLALLAGIVVTMVAIREEGQLLDIPSIWWGIIALTIAFFSMYAWIGRQAETDTETTTVV